MAPAIRGHRRARPDPVRRPCLSGLRPRARGGCVGVRLAARQPATRRSSRRAATRISASIATGSARCSSRRRRRSATAVTAMAHVFAAARAKCGRCRPIMARRLCASSSTTPQLHERLARRAQRDARPDQLGAAADRRRRSAAGLYRPPIRHVLDAAADARSRCWSCAREHAIYMADSGRFNVVGMGDAAARPIHRRRGRSARRLNCHASRVSWLSDAGVLAKSDSPRSTGARSRGWSDEPRDGPARGGGPRSGQEGPLPVQRARARHGAGPARTAALQGWRRGMRLLSLAAAAAGAGRAARRRARLGHGPRRRLFGRARYRRRVQLSQPGRRARAADVRRRRRAIYARRRLGAGDRVQAQACWAKGHDGRDRGGAGRRRVLRDQRLLGGADDRDDAAIADALLHRGQWLWHLGAVRVPDAGRRHRRKPRELFRA